MAHSVELRIIGPDGSVKEMSLPEGESLIFGSGVSANVRLDDPNVSSIHAMIKHEDGVVSAVDLGSESGVRVHGVDVTEEDLDSGDVVEIGGYKVQVALGMSTGPDLQPTQESNTPEGIAADAKGAIVAKGKESTMGSSFKTESSGISVFSEVIPPEERPSVDNRMLEVVMVWSDTVIGVGHFLAKEGTVSVGEDPKATFNVASEIIPETLFTLIRPGGKDHVVNLAEGMDVQIRDEKGDVIDIEGLSTAGRMLAPSGEYKGKSFVLGLHEQAVIGIGDTKLVLRYVRPSKRIVTNVFKQIDYYFTKVFSTSFIAHILFIIALMMTPVNLERLSDDLFANPNRFAQLIVQPEQEDERVFEDLSTLDELAQEDETEFGEIEEEPEVEPDEDTPVVDVDQREEDMKKVLDTGLLAALEDGAASNVFGPSALGTGINEALGGIDGEGGGDAFGLGGLGSRSGAGSGGSALGIGQIGTKGGSGARVDLSDRDRAPTKITGGQTIIEGGLDREVIARIVRRHQNEIRFCYERELQRDPNLHGRVAVQWIIDGTGAVARATIADSTMANSNVENCILVRIRRWRFPEPRGGGIVRVTYPWIFSPRA